MGLNIKGNLKIEHTWIHLVNDCKWPQSLVVQLF